MGFAVLYHPKEAFCGMKPFSLAATGVRVSSRVRCLRLLKRIHRDRDIGVDPRDLAQQVGADRRIKRWIVRSAFKSVGEGAGGAGLP